MVIYPNTVKRQGNIILGITEIIIAIVFSGIVIAVAAYMQNRGFPYYFIPYIFAVLILLGGSTMGAIDLIKGIRGRIVMRDGYKTSCVVVSKGYYHSHSNRTGPYIVVEYVSQTNKKHMLRFSPGYHQYARIKMGATIECYVLGESCYINTKEEIKILSEPEKEMSIKDAFKSLFKDTN
jgi:hypothetical protein